MKNLDCETSRDWIALELYGELETDEHTLLARHVAGCDACREARAALQRGLGRLVDPVSGQTPSPVAPPVPARAGVGSRWLAAGAGFAAGALLTASLAGSISRPGGSPEPAPPGPVERAPRGMAVAAARDFGLPERPPQAASSGRVTEIRAWMRE